MKASYLKIDKFFYVYLFLITLFSISSQYLFKKIQKKELPSSYLIFGVTMYALLGFVIYKLFNCYPSNKSLISLIDRLNVWLKQKKEINNYTKIVINKNIILKITQLANDPRKSDKNDNINIVILFNK
jgi:hypothetical protein